MIKPTASLACLLLLAACSNQGATFPEPNVKATNPEPTATTPTPAATVSSRPDKKPTFSTNITNEWWPMKPGTRWIYRGLDGQDKSKIVVTVTHETKTTAAGIEGRMVRDTVYENGEITEDTKDLYAQRSDGAIVYLGETTSEYDHGTPTSSEGSFEAGVDGAEYGVAMPGNPKPGPKYEQEHYPGHAMDEGRVLGTVDHVETRVDRYDDALLTVETTPLEPNGAELKFFAKGVGQVRAIDVSGGKATEELIKITHVSKKAGTGPLGDPS